MDYIGSEGAGELSALARAGGSAVAVAGERRMAGCPGRFRHWIVHEV